MIRMLLVMAVLVIFTGSADADPISLTASAIAALLPATSAVVVGSITVAQVIATAVVVGGSYLASSILAPSGPGSQSVDPTDAKSTFETTEAPELRAIGRVRIAGLKVFGATHYELRYRLIAHCRGPIDGLEAHYLGGREVIVDVSGAITSPPYVNSSGVYIYIQTKLGSSSEVAWSDLLTSFAGQWTSDHRLRGIAQSLITYVSPGLDSPLFLKLYQQGPPEYECVVRGELVYDPRTDAEAWSDNGILACLHVALSFDELSLSDFDMDVISAEADRADELVETLTGSEKRARAWGVWSSETPRDTVLKEVMDSVGAEMVTTSEGLLAFRLIDDAPSAEASIPLSHIVDLKLRSGQEAVERPNCVSLKYYSAERNYSMAEINLSGVPWATVDDEIVRYGRKNLPIELKFCPSAAQAQRIARRMFSVARGDQGVVTTNFYGLSVWGCRRITVELPDLDASPLVAIAPPRVDDEQGSVEIPFTVWPALETWSPDDHEALPPEQVPADDLGAELTTPLAPSAAAAVGSIVRVRFELPGDATTSEMVFRIPTAVGPGIWQSMAEALTPYPYGFAAVTAAGAHVQFRVRGSDDDGRLSPWSPILDVNFPAVDTTPPDPPSISSVDDGFGSTTVTVVAPETLNVYSLHFTGSSAPSPAAVTPGQSVSFSAATGTGPWTAQAFNTDGYGSSIVST